MRNLKAALACSALALAGASNASAQSAIPVVTLAPASAKTTQTLGTVLSVRQLSDGGILVDDGARRQVLLLDATLANATIVIDSASGTSRSYGRRPAPLIRYLGDSTLLPDYASRTLVVLNARGEDARTIAMPTPSDVGLIARGAAIDNAGRIVYAGSAKLLSPTSSSKDSAMQDSIPILRADFALRRTDTIGHISRPLGKTSALSPDGKSLLQVWTVDPLRTIDDWAMLTDGSIALVRGHDYHIDWIRPSGTMASTRKLAFDWKAVNDDDKRRIIDSTQAQMRTSIASGSFMDRAEQVEVLRGAAAAAAAASAGVPLDGGERGGDRAQSGRAAAPGFAGFTLLPTDVIPLEKIADFYPPIRTGAVNADRDGNLWILPTTSKQSRRGELVYDVVNANGELFQRVRVPLGRLIVGFGQGGTVFMVSGDRTNGFYLERSTLP